MVTVKKFTTACQAPTTAPATADQAPANHAAMALNGARNGPANQAATDCMNDQMLFHTETKNAPICLWYMMTTTMMATSAAMAAMTIHTGAAARLIPTAANIAAV